jgi:hypothetical protein
MSENFDRTERGRSISEKLVALEKTFSPRAVIARLEGEIQRLGGLTRDDRSERRIDRNLLELNEMRTLIENARSQFDAYLEERDEIVPRSYQDNELKECQITIDGWHAMVLERIEEASL